MQFTAAAAAAAPAFTASAATLKAKLPLKQGGENYNYYTGTKRKAVPTACAMCASRCPAIAYVEKGFVVKLEGNPESVRTRGLICSKGQAAINQVYDPDRILFPMRRTGKRGDGKWERISWDEALDDLAGRLKAIRDAGHPEKLMLHYGWISAAADRLINQVFMPSFGSKTISSNICHGQSARQTAHELTWGGATDNWDFDKAHYVLNFGSNVMEAHTNHVALAQRLSSAIAERQVKMVTFDVRMSNTASKSNQWVQILPGTDLAVVLAMCHVVLKEGLNKGAGEEFLDFCKVTENAGATRAEKIAALKAHFKKFTPEWAQRISKVDAETIREITREMCANQPACIISSRGAIAHYNGVETERAIQMLSALTGNIDVPGGRCMAVAPNWTFPTGPKNKPEPRELEILNGFQGDAALPLNGVDSQILRLIKDGQAGRPEVYICYNHNPVYAHADVKMNMEILKDENLIPFTVAVTPFYDESAALSDLILPDATFLERFDFEDGVAADQVPEYYIRQPAIAPLGEARDFKDVCCDLAKRLRIKLGFKSAEDFVAKTCKKTKVIKKRARGFKGMRKKGVWHDRKANPTYFAYKQEVSAEQLAGENVLFDAATGVYWDWKEAHVASREEAERTGYRAATGSCNGYIGQKIGDKVYVGFKPGQLNKTGCFEIYSEILKEKGYSALPSFIAEPEQFPDSADKLTLTTYRVNTHTLSTSQNCKWLSEVFHFSPAWINPKTAAAKQIEDGDKIKIQSGIGEIETVAKVTETVAPGVVAISSHGGHWEYGRYASDRAAPFGAEDASDEKRKWWKQQGVHPNWIIPVAVEPISGQQRWMDIQVKVVKAA